MARPVWSGSLSFGLVNVPVKAYSAVRDHDVHFHQLDKETGARVRNRKVSEESGEELDKSDIEMGYEVSKGRYVTFARDELSELQPESTRAVEITDFVAIDEIDPIYYERTYWLAPDGDQVKQSYQLLLAAMEDRARVGIGTVVMRNKQYLTAIRPLDGALAMSTMRFSDEIVPRKDIDDLPSRRSKPDAKTLKTATQLIDALSTDWEPEQYHDTYTEQLKELIRAKDAGEEISVEEPSKPRAEIVDLMEALQASVDDVKSGRRRKSPGSTSSKKGSSKKASSTTGSSKKGSSKTSSSTKRRSAKQTSSSSKAKARKSA